MLKGPFMCERPYPRLSISTRLKSPNLLATGIQQRAVRLTGCRNKTRVSQPAAEPRSIAMTEMGPACPLTEMADGATQGSSTIRADALQGLAPGICAKPAARLRGIVEAGPQGIGRRQRRAMEVPHLPN